MEIGLKKRIAKRRKLTDKVLGTHSFTFNHKDNGGEQFTLSTVITSNGDEGREGICLNQKLTLHSYGNMASFDLSTAALWPEALRKLADQLQDCIAEAAAKNSLDKV